VFKLRSIVVPVVLVAGTLLTDFCYPQSPAARSAPGRTEAQVKLEALRKQLPDAINRGLEKSAGIGFAKKDIKVSLCRRLSATEAKVTILLGGGGDFPPSIVSFYLSYFDGAWTTTRHEERCVGAMNGREKCVIDMAFAIDETGNTK
jgi:hypothetical protein